MVDAESLANRRHEVAGRDGTVGDIRTSPHPFYHQSEWQKRVLLMTNLMVT